MTAAGRRLEAERPSSFALQLAEGRRAKTVLRIPESHALYVCPAGCARRRAIRAMENGVDADCSYLVLDESDVVSGGYEDCIREAVDEVLSRTEKRPPVVTVATPCIDHLLSTDLDGLCAELGEAHPGTFFLPNRLAPIGVRGKKRPEALGAYTSLFAPLLARAGDRAHDEGHAGGSSRTGVTVLGSYTPLPATSEIHGALELMGALPVRDLVSCATYADYLALGSSRASLTVSHAGSGAARLLEERLGMPGMAWQACYGIDETLRRYRRLAEVLDWRDGDALAGFLAPFADRAGRERDACADALRGWAVAVDTSATMVPFSLALDLLDAGIEVRCILALHSKGNDEREEELLESHPEVRVARTRDALGMLGGAPEADGRLIALGRDAATLLHTTRSVSIYHDEGFFGLDGIARLYGAMRSCVEEG